MRGRGDLALQELAVPSHRMGGSEWTVDLLPVTGSCRGRRLATSEALGLRATLAGHTAEKRSLCCAVENKLSPGAHSPGANARGKVGHSNDGN